MSNSTTPFVLVPLPSNISLEELYSFFASKNANSACIYTSKIPYIGSPCSLPEKLSDEIDDLLLSAKVKEKEGYNITLTQIIGNALKVLLKELSPISNVNFKANSLKAKNLISKIYEETPEFKIYRVSPCLLNFLYVTACKEGSIDLIKYWLDNPIRTIGDVDKDIIALFHSIAQDCLSYKGRDKNYELIRKVAYASKIVVPTYICTIMKYRRMF